MVDATASQKSSKKAREKEKNREEEKSHKSPRGGASGIE